MKQILLYFTLAGLLFACAKENVKTYDAENYVYFGPRYEYGSAYPVWDTIQSINFRHYYNLLDTTIYLQVYAGGILSDQDRYYKVAYEVDGGTEGVEYTAVEERHIMPANSNVARLPITLHRTDLLADSTLRIRVRLEPGYDFTTNMPYYVDINPRVNDNRLHYTIEYTASVSTPPLWTSRLSILGYFSELKFNTMNDYLGMTQLDWIDTQGAFYRNFNSYVIVFVNYLNGLIAEGWESALKDPHPSSHRGYMFVTGFPAMGVPAVTIPGDFPSQPQN